MKKLLFSISVICCLAVSSGIVINSHYCMKRLVAIHLFESKARQCGKCGMDTHESDATGCCRDQVKVVKLEQDQNKIDFKSPELAKPDLPTPDHCGYLVSPAVSMTASKHFHNHSPPLLWSARDIYLRINVLRI